jgi:uncharacterized protein
VTVTEVDVARKRIALTMKGEGNQKPEAGTGKPEKKNFNKKPEPLNSFQNKLLELKKKFND